MPDRISEPALDLKRTSNDPAIRITARENQASVPSIDCEGGLRLRSAEQVFLDVTVGSTSSISVDDGQLELEGFDSLELRLGNGGGSILLEDGTITFSGDLGFYDAIPVAQQTGVAVTTGAIHAALVALGLITA